MIRLLFFLYILLFSFGCKTNCEVHPATRCLIEKKLEILQDLNPPCLIGGKVYAALFFFEKVADLQTNAAYGDVSTYQNKQDLRNDIRQYTDWYENNKCDLNPHSLLYVESNIIQSLLKWSDVEEEYLQHIEKCKKLLK